MKKTSKVECYKITLVSQINKFIEWYLDNIMKNDDYLTKEREKKFLLNFIEKMAIWYELRYPEYEINRILPCTGQERTNINDVMFRDNPYIIDLLPDDTDVKELEWAEFYNKKAFFNGLTWKEQSLLINPRYNSTVLLDPPYGSAIIHLSPNGIVIKSENVGIFTNNVIRDSELRRKTAKDVLSIFQEREIALPCNNELEKTYRNFQNRAYLKKGLLDSVMYRIIERGGNRIGPRRAFLFAKDFQCNIDIPMMYGVDYSDPGLRLFVNEYIKAGGSPDLECYTGYFFYIYSGTAIETVSIRQVLLDCSYNFKNFYTPEEDSLHQRLVDTLNYQAQKQKVKK